MTIALPGSARQNSFPPITGLLMPGVVEKAMVILTFFIFIHSTPDTWLRTRSDFLQDSSNPIGVLLELGLVVLAFMRIAGNIDQLIVMFRLESLVYSFTGLVALSVFWSASPGITIKESIQLVSITIYASYLVMRFSLEQIVRLLSWVFTISAVLNLAVVVALPQYGIGGEGDWTGIFPQKNALGFFAALAVPTLIIGALGNRRMRPFFVPATLIQLALLFGSQSKTMLMACLVPVALMGVYNMFRSKQTLRGAVMVSLLGSAVFTVVFVTANLEVLATSLDKDTSLTGRVPLWQALIPVIREKPILGHGYGAAFNDYFSPVHEVLIQNRWDPSHAHNAVLQISLEVGLLGTFLFLALYFRTTSRAIKILAIVPGAIGLWPLVFMTTTLLVSLTESGVTDNTTGWILFVVAVLTVSLHLKHRTDLGLSNDLRTATMANAKGITIR